MGISKFTFSNEYALNGSASKPGCPCTLQPYCASSSVCIPTMSGKKDSTASTAVSSPPKASSSQNIQGQKDSNVERDPGENFGAASGPPSGQDSVPGINDISARQWCAAIMADSVATERAAHKMVCVS